MMMMMTKGEQASERERERDKWQSDAVANTVSREGEMYTPNRIHMCAKASVSFANIIHFQLNFIKTRRRRKKKKFEVEWRATAKLAWSCMNSFI